MATTPIVILFLATNISYQEPAKPSGWTTFTPREGDFQIEFPARPQEQGKALPSREGTIQQRVYYVRSGGCLFSVQRFHYPRSIPILQVTDRLAQQKQGLLQGQVELVRENKITVNDVTGDHLEYKSLSPRANGTVTSLTRQFIKGPSYYAITVVSSPNQDLPRDADRFLDSFHFTKANPAKAGATPKAGTTAKGQRKAMAKSPAGVGRPPLLDSTPEDAVRTFMVVAVRQDEVALRAITLPDRELVELLQGPPAPPEAVEKIRSIAADMKFKRLKPGDPIKLPPQGRSAVVHPEEVTDDRVLLLPEHSDFPIRLWKIEGHWKVDVRTIVAARKATAAARQNAKEK